MPRWYGTTGKSATIARDGSRNSFRVSPSPRPAFAKLRNKFHVTEPSPIVSGPGTGIKEHVLRRGAGISPPTRFRCALRERFAAAKMISVVELTKHFAVGDRTIVAVDHLSFQVQAGEVYGLLGPNGAGKTTTLWMVLGVLQPTSGYAEVGGFRSTEVPNAVKERLGLVSASAGVYPWLTTRETLLFFADLYHVPPERARVAVDRISRTLGLTSFLDQRCATLSTGQKQRVNLARALIHDPQIMLFDEPTRGLDVWGSKVIFDYVRHLRDAGKAVIVSTHRLDEAQRLCDRFGLLHYGRLLHEGTLSELQQRTGCQSLTEMFLRFAESDSSTQVETP